MAQLLQSQEPKKCMPISEDKKRMLTNCFSGPDQNGLIIIQTAEKTVDFLEYLPREGTITLDDVCEELGVSREYINYIARALSNRGFLLQDTLRQTLQSGPKLRAFANNKLNRPAESLPKGIDGNTLEKIMEILFRSPPGCKCSAMDLARSMGVTRVTARRYLEFLTEIGIAERSQCYLQVGRPIAKYCVVATDDNYMF